MSISPISASSLYQEQIHYFLYATHTDYSSVSNLLALYGVKSSGDAQKDLVKLQEIQTKTAVENKQSLSGDDKTVENTSGQASRVWYSIMYQLGLEPTGTPEKDFKEIMESLVDKIRSAESQSEYDEYMGLMDLVEGLFISSGVKISDIAADSVSIGETMNILANYSKASIENA